jgi:long-chain fatty acid transport protein
VNRRALVYLLLTGLTANAGAVGSGGYTNQAVSAKALGMGNVFAAVADDLSTIYFNPAGLTSQTSFSVSLAAFPTIPSTKYTLDDESTDKTKHLLALVPYLYAASPVTDRLTIGFGVNSPFGLETHWGEEGPLRYQATDSELVYIGFNPTVAYRLSDRVSVGAGVVYARVSARMDSRLNETALNSYLNTLPTVSPDGKKSLQGDGGGWGWNAGLLCDLGDGQSVGLSYRSAIRADIKGETRLSDLSDTTAFVFGGDSYTTTTETDLDFPASVIVGYAYRQGPWTWAVDGEWTGYSVVKNTPLTFSESDPTRSAILNDGNPIMQSWTNTWNFGAGVDRKLTPSVSARAGFSYFPAVVPETTWEPSTPDAAIYAYTVGSGWTRGDCTLDLAYVYFDYVKRHVHNGVGASSGATVNGAYKTVAHVISVSMSWRLGGK